MKVYCFREVGDKFTVGGAEDLDGRIYLPTYYGTMARRLDVSNFLGSLFRHRMPILKVRFRLEQLGCREISREEFDKLSVME